MIKRYIVGFLLVVLSQIGFGLTFVMGSLLTKKHGVSPEVLSFLRFAFAGVFMLCFGCATAHGRKALCSPQRQDWLTMLWLGPVGTSIMAWFVFVGCAHVSVANASMADALTPLMIFATSAVVTRHLEGRGLVGLVCGFVGSILVVQILSIRGLEISAYSVGDVYILLAAATWGVYTVCGRNLVCRFGSFVFTTWTMLIGTAAIGLVLPFLTLVWPQTSEMWELVILLALGSTLMPFWAWNAAQKYLPMSVLAISAYFAPVVAMTMAVLFIDERVSGLQWLGTVFIIASAVVETGRQQSVENQPTKKRLP